jgi:hypothetical protein
LKNKCNSETKIQVFYHLYNDNRGEDLIKAREFCLSRGFEFQTIWASIISLDDLLIYNETGYLPDAAKEAAELLEIDINTTLSRAKSDAYKKCQVQNIICINWDLRVPDCSQFFSQENYITADNFLEMPLSDIISKKRQSSLCTICKKHGLHRFCEIFSNDSTDHVYDDIDKMSFMHANDVLHPTTDL